MPKDYHHDACPSCGGTHITNFERPTLNRVDHECEDCNRVWTEPFDSTQPIIPLDGE